MGSLRQIHSAKVLAVDGAGIAGEGDALVTATPALAVSVRTADCYPILLADTRNRAVAAIHAGWRGTAAGIVSAALQTMTAQYNTRAEDICAAIGPGIGYCCYEVGEEVARQFGRDAAGCVDLAAENRTQLLGAGVPSTNIEITGGCTRCDTLQFHSFRRDKDQAGRMISFLSVQH